MSHQERQRPQSQRAGMRPARFVIKRPSTSTSFTRTSPRSRPKVEAFSSAGSRAGRSSAPRANLKARHFYSRKSTRERSQESNSRTNVLAKFAAASVRSKSRAVHVESRRRRPQTVSPNARKRKGVGAHSSSTVKAWGERAVQTAKGRFPLQHVAQRSPGSSMFSSAKQNKVKLRLLSLSSHTDLSRYPAVSSWASQGSPIQLPPSSPVRTSQSRGESSSIREEEGRTERKSACLDRFFIFVSPSIACLCSSPSTIQIHHGLVSSGLL